MTAINLAYDEHEQRGYLKQKAIALVLTLGAIVAVLVSLVLVAVVPVVLNHIGLSATATVATQAARWLLLVAVMIVGLAVVYRVARTVTAPA
jgi:membrane protein